MDTLFGEIETISENLTIYDEIIIEAYKLATRNPTIFGDFCFGKSDLENIVREGRYQVRNIPDIKYTYDARRDFPEYIRDRGNYAILGLGKGKYCFTELPQPNLIRIEESPCEISFNDETPSLVQDVLGKDEQATFSIIHYNDLITKLLGIESYLVQNHERTSLSIGQVEIDSIYVGQKDDTKYIIPISGKGGKDRLSYTQAVVLNIFAKEKYPDYQCIPLGVKAGTDKIDIIQFNDNTNIAEISIEKSSRFITIT